MIIQFSILLISSTICSAVLSPDCKNYKQTTYDSFACVCTEAQLCDKIERPVKTAAGVVTKWESSRDGARLRKSTLHFGQNNTNDVHGELHIRVDSVVEHQTIFGFGGAFTDATGINLHKLGPNLSQQILEDYFSGDGLEYNVGRIPIGGSDFSTHPYTYDDDGPDLNLDKFALANEDFIYKIPYILKAKSLSTHEIRLFGSPWSAPAWMKTNNDIAHGGSIKGVVNTEHWQTWAKYFVRYLNAYQDQNITHWGITIQNQPMFSMKFNSMNYSPEMMRDFLATTLGPELERSGWGTDKLKVMIYDHNIDLVLDWARIILANETARNYTAGIAIHWYAYFPQTLLDKVDNLYPDKFILATEACEGPGVRLGAWSMAERYAYDIIMDLLHHVIGWTDWNMVLNMGTEDGGPNWVNNVRDAPIIADIEEHQYYRQPHFYAMAHFSKFLAPGSRRIDSEVISQNNSKAIVAAFRTAQNDSTVVIVVNNDETTVRLTLDDTKVGRLVANVEPRSIQTYVYYD